MSFRDIENFRQQFKELADFSVKEITHICDTFGPRPCGEEGEKKAQEYMMELLKKSADETERTTFSVHPEAFMAFVPIAGTLCLGSAASNIVSVYKKNKKPAALAAGLTATALAAVVGEFGLYKKPLDPFFKKKISGDVYAVRKAKGETKRRIIISGHTDSAPEWTYTYKLGSKGVVSVAGYAVAGLVGGIATSAASLCSKNEKLKKGLALSQLAFLPGYAALYAFTNNKKYVPGASDDLSGCFIAQSVMKFLADNDIRFENTEVVALLAGGEECGLRGSEAFFAAYPEMKDDNVETIFVGFDTVRDEEYMMIYNRDLNGLVKNDDEVCELVRKAAEKCGKEVPLGAIPLGSTDAAAVSRAGVKAAAFVAMDPAPARYYHTRLDTPSNLCATTIEKTIEIAMQTIYDFDENGLK